MRSKVYLSVIFLGLIFLLTACADTRNTTPTSTAAPVTVSLTTDPDPAVVGDVMLKFQVNDGQGKPINDATVTVLADHTDMRGMTMGGAATDQGNGIYAIGTNFSMKGKWKVTVQVTSSTLNYEQEIMLTVN